MTLVEPIIKEPWEHMEVQVPHILVAGGFVVLPDRKSLAAVSLAHGLSDHLREVPDGVAVFGWHLVEVLDVTPGYHEGAARVGGPPLRRDACVGTIGYGDHVAWLIVLVHGAGLETAEGTFVSGRLMGRRLHLTMLPSPHVGHALPLVGPGPLR